MNLVTYPIARTGTSKLLLLETVSVVDPFFLCVLTDPFTSATKTATIQPEGFDGEWIVTIVGIAQAYEDLLAGEIYFDNEGTWNCAIYLNEVTDSALIRTIQLQVRE